VCAYLFIISIYVANRILSASSTIMTDEPQALKHWSFLVLKVTCLTIIIHVYFSDIVDTFGITKSRMCL